LVPKNSSPINVNDFRPISLINCATKIITKILGTRLHQEIIPLAHLNQYGFIKARTLQYCLAWAFEYIHQCHYSRREIVILDLDFTKAFDTIVHTAVLQMMQQLGFSAKWIGWVAQILSTTTTLVLLNGFPRKNINCQRGVRQGDPLSHLLFVLAVDLLQRSLIEQMNKAFFNYLYHLEMRQDSQ
jgi:retron-type reverse transcriptase